MSAAHRHGKPEGGPRASKTRGKYRRARIRNFIFSIGPHRLTRGLTTRLHLGSEIMVRAVEVSSPFWPRAFDGMRIAHVSDFHLGNLLPLERALGVIDQVRDLRPDLLACTGDVVDLHNREAAPLLDAMAGVDAPLGSMLVLGNHDHLHDGPELAEMARRSGIRVLDNESVRVKRKHDELLIGGIDWAKSAPHCAKLVDAACGDFVHLLLAHNPRAFLRAADLRIPLTLCGHTHGGQVAIKHVPTANFALAHRHRAGLYDSHGSRLYVTTGIGAWFPLRLNCPAEVALLTVRRAEVPLEEHNIGAGKRRRRSRRTP
jgi:uncharacterized protein